MTIIVEDGTKFSFSSVKFAEFDEIMHSDPASLKNIVSKVLTWLIRTRWRRAIWGTLSVIKCKLSFQATRFSPFVTGKPYHNVVSGERCLPMYFCN